MFGRITSSRATTTVNVRISVSAVLFPRRRLTTKLQNLLNLTNSAGNRAAVVCISFRLPLE
jgi:hypothetical protein